MKDALARVYEISSSKLPIILALDLYSKHEGEKKKLFSKCVHILNCVKKAISGVKIGLPLLLTLEKATIRELIKGFHEEL
ncbi:MAG: hypothetical protein QXH96_01740, partial [Candidatus Geothermarchaeota archaeon]